jgi:hypothetical protein
VQQPPIKKAQGGRAFTEANRRRNFGAGFRAPARALETRCRRRTDRQTQQRNRCPGRTDRQTADRSSKGTRCSRHEKGGARLFADRASHLNAPAAPPLRIRQPLAASSRPGTPAPLAPSTVPPRQPTPASHWPGRAPPAVSSQRCAPNYGDRETGRRAATHRPRASLARPPIRPITARAKARAQELQRTEPRRQTSERRPAADEPPLAAAAAAGCAAGASPAPPRHWGHEPPTAGGRHQPAAALPGASQAGALGELAPSSAAASGAASGGASCRR